MENVTHYVENELFKDRPPPPKTNARFYPTSKLLYNHSRAKLGIRAKVAKKGRPKKGEGNQTEQRQPKQQRLEQLQVPRQRLVDVYS